MKKKKFSFWMSHNILKSSCYKIQQIFLCLEFRRSQISLFKLYLKKRVAEQQFWPTSPTIFCSHRKGICAPQGQFLLVIIWHWCFDNRILKIPVFSSITSNFGMAFKRLWQGFQLPLYYWELHRHPSFPNRSSFYLFLSTNYTASLSFLS